MKILPRIRGRFALIGFLPDERYFGVRFAHTLVSILIFVILLMQEMCSITFMVTHFRAGDIEGGLYAAFQVSAVIPLIGSFITIMYNRHTIGRVIVTIQQIVNECKRCNTTLLSLEYHMNALHSAGENKVSAFFMRADQISEKFANYALFLTMGSFLFTSIALVLCEASFYYLRDERIDLRKLHLPFKFR